MDVGNLAFGFTVFIVGVAFFFAAALVVKYLWQNRKKQ